MEASQITKLLQKQHTRTIHRPQTTDSSTLTWKQQIRSSTYLREAPVASLTPCCDVQAPSYGGQGRQTTLMTGSAQQYPNVLAGASGSASRLYSSDAITLQRAGKQACGNTCDATLSAPCDIELPACFCENTNVPSPTNPTVNPQTNPYLPPFDTYYRFKHPQCTNREDANQKHFVAPCCGSS
jgi:hypothetical protein